MSKCGHLILHEMIRHTTKRVNPAMYEVAWKLVTKLLRYSLNVPPVSPYVSSCFTHCFPSFFWYFPCFPWYFSLFPFLGFTPKDVSKDISKIELIIAFKDSNLLLRELMLSWSVIKFPGFFNQKFFSSVNQFVRLLERLGLRLTVLQFSRGVSIFHCLLYLVSFAFKKKMLIKF